MIANVFCRRLICNGSGCKRRFLSTLNKTPPPHSPPVRYEFPKKTIVNDFPSSWQPYLRLIRLDRPIGTYLLYWPCAWSIVMATEPGALPHFSLLATFAVGSFVMRGAGCIINDLWDRKYDSKVFRTATRPIASGEITPFKGLVFLGAHLTAGLCVLLSLNQYSILLGMASLPLITVYPLMKRYTFWPQAVLGLSFNWGALMGYSAVCGYCNWSVCIPLYLACVSWTLFYDTIYSYQDIRDDIKLGLKSTAIKFGSNGKYWLSSFAASTSLLLLASGYQASLSWPYLFGVAAVSCHFAWQIQTVNLSDPVQCLKIFKSNNHVGFLLLLALFATALVKVTN